MMNVGNKDNSVIYITTGTVEDLKVTGTVVRPEVARFAIEMERILKLNDWKGGWKKDEPATDPEAKQSGNTLAFFKNKLHEEFIELRHEMLRETLRPDALRREAADVANIAMMIADNWGELMKEEK